MAEENTVKAEDTGIKTVGVVGSGQMGVGIAEVVARAGHDVVVRAREQAAADGVIAALDRSLAKQVAKGKIDEDARKQALGHVIATTSLRDLRPCDLVVETVVEDREVKKHLFGELDRWVKPNAILATNTSTLSVVEFAVETGRPERVCGIHFFNPAPAMPLIEIVRPLTASDETIAAATAFAVACGKEPVEVADRAGFIVNALLFPYLNNAVRMLESGTATMEAIDAAMRGGCGFPMGPFALIDLVGLDTSVAILDALHDEFGDPSYVPMPLLRRMVTAGRCGRKAGRGFYDY